MGDAPVSGYCCAQLYNCGCARLRDHEGSHACVCGGSWHYQDDGTLQIDRFPILPMTWQIDSVGIFNTLTEIVAAALATEISNEASNREPEEK